MVMPAAGKIIRGYDAKKNQGIDIAAPAGSGVKAADAGTVTVLSADTNGKGIVIIRHAGDLLTVYVGVSGMVVKKGDKVKRGQEIGKVAPGDPAFVHFEVRNTSKQSFDPQILAVPGRRNPAEFRSDFRSEIGVSPGRWPPGSCRCGGRQGRSPRSGIPLR